MKTVKALLYLIALAASLVTFSGCKTAHGFGEDVESLGNWIQEGTTD